MLLFSGFVYGFDLYKPAQVYVQVVLGDAGFKGDISAIRSNKNHLCGGRGYMQHIAHISKGPFQQSSFQYSMKF